MRLAPVAASISAIDILSRYRAGTKERANIGPEWLVNVVTHTLAVVSVEFIRDIPGFWKCDQQNLPLDDLLNIPLLHRAAERPS